MPTLSQVLTVARKVRQVFPDRADQHMVDRLLAGYRSDNLLELFAEHVYAERAEEIEDLLRDMEDTDVAGAGPLLHELCAYLATEDEDDEPENPPHSPTKPSNLPPDTVY